MRQYFYPRHAVSFVSPELSPKDSCLKRRHIHFSFTIISDESILLLHNSHSFIS